MAVCEAVEHGCDVGFRIEAVQLRGFGDGVDDRSALPAYIATDEQEVLSRDSDAPQLPGAVAGCVENGRGYLRRDDGTASGSEVNAAFGGRLTEALPAVDLAHADLA